MIDKHEVTVTGPAAVSMPPAGNAGPRPWDALPRLRLAHLPTPLTRLDRFSEAVGAEVWLKRDDIGSITHAGNKARKLEFLLADAETRGCDVVLTMGGPQSNHARATAAYCAGLGLRCILVLGGDPPPDDLGNLLLDRLLGAEVIFAGARDFAGIAARMAEIAADLEREGARPYPITIGGSTALGAVGFAVGYDELLGQLREAGVGATAVYLASASGGTHAGLEVGRRLTGDGPPVEGIAILKPEAGGSAEHVAELASGCATLLGLRESWTERDIRLDPRFMGPGYGSPTPEASDAIALLARTQGILADPVYSGKALAGVLAHLREGRAVGPVVFWHTGGAQVLLHPQYAGPVLAAAGARRS
jgi:D-cysteine desulfhydrase family pyridoxal phosphate-dependent enzyme